MDLASEKVRLPVRKEGVRVNVLLGERVRDGQGDAEAEELAEATRLLAAGDGVENRVPFRKPSAF